MSHLQVQNQIKIKIQSAQVAINTTFSPNTLAPKKRWEYMQFELSVAHIYVLWVKWLLKLIRQTSKVYFWVLQQVFFTRTHTLSNNIKSNQAWMNLEFCD